MRKVLIITGIIVLIGSAAGFFVWKKYHDKKTQSYTLVPVAYGNIVEKALAVGKIEPKQEIAVKSMISGIINKIYVDVGDMVDKGTPLFEISPNPTPYEYAEIKADVNLKEVGYNNAKNNNERFVKLFDLNLISREELEKSQRAYDEAKLQLDLARERLALLEKGGVVIGDRKVENVIRAPINGMILERKVDVGDPVVPLTSYQAGTELMTIANMEHLIFKGTVDEIDVGKFHETMPAVINIGALPGKQIDGTITKIAPKAKIEQNATLFDIEIKLSQSDSVFLRAGYSANADIIINKKDNVLSIPERLVTFRADSTFVETEIAPGKPVEKEITLGISDGINVEVVKGLKEGEKIVEHPPKKVE
jgi:HlyD family secretion protein